MAMQAINTARFTWLLLCVIALFTFISQSRYKETRGKRNQVIAWDVSDYYVYLPALFIHDDMELKGDWLAEPGARATQIFKHDDGGHFIKMSGGLAILYSPFFALAHGVASATDQWPADGYSLPYQFAIGFAGLTFAMLGLWFLMRILSRRFSQTVTSFALVILFLGSNLLYYSTFRSAMGHAFSFCLLAGLMHGIDRFHDNSKGQTSAWLAGMGFAAGLMVLIRPVNLILILILLAWQLPKGRLPSVKQWFLLVVAACLAILPQLLFWHHNTGHWLVYSYGEEGFFFTDPQLWNGLFSFRKGWLLYSPLMALPLLGLWRMRRHDKLGAKTLLVGLSLFVFITFSWWCWWYGGSFGARPLIDCYPLLAIPLAHALSSMEAWPIHAKRLARGGLVLLIALSVFQNWQYMAGIIHHDSMSQSTYEKVFLKLHFPEGYKATLDPPDYQAALRGKH
jgi:hypothetical protein